MKRRNFIKNTIPVALLPTFLQGQHVTAMGPNSVLGKMAAAFTDTDHVLVLVQLSGGNDGLNMVIPLDKYGILGNARSNVLIPDTKVLKLNGTTATGLHPSMTHLQKLYNDGKLNIVQNVGYPDPNYSHFRATDIWLSGSDSNQVLNTGWQGRYLAGEYPNFPTGYPNANMPDPLSIVIGSLVSPAFQGPAVNMAMSISDPANFYNMINGTTDPVPNTNAGHELSYIRTVADQTTQYATVIKAAAAKATNKSTLWPTAKKNKLADQLKIVSQLIAGGLKTRVYMVNLGGFDNHSNQVDLTDHTKGVHADLLFNLSQAIEAFMDDCQLLGIANRIMGMTFSEFGRRIVSNQSGGTDHGAAAPVILFGNQVKSGITGSSPNLPQTPTVNDNVDMEHDFRQIYTTIMKDWFCLNPADVKATMLKDFTPLSIINSTCNSNAIADDIRKNSGTKLLSIYPNPMIDQSNLSIESKGGNVLVRLYTMEGKEVETLVNENLAPGTHQIAFARKELTAGLYIVRMDHNLMVQTKTLVVQ